MRRLAPAVLVAAVAATYFASFVGYGINLEDEGTILFQIGRTLRGEVPYLDFHTGYTPASFYVNALLFRLFGESVIPLRVLLVAVNAGTIACVFLLARSLAGGALAAVAALGYAAYLPLFVGDFASFNVPYPAWYAGLAWLATQWAVDRHLAAGRGRTLLGAGIAAGITFSFKPNSGVLAVLAVGLVLAFLAAGDGDGDRRGARVLLVAGLGVLILVLASALHDFVAFEEVTIDFPLIAGVPLVLLLGRLVWVRTPAPHPSRLWPGVTLVALGAALPTVPWLAYFLVQLGPARFAREVLLLGSDAEKIYAMQYPLPVGFPAGWGLIVSGGLVGVGWLGVAVERGRLRLPHALGVVLTAAAAAALLLWWRARMPEGVLRAVVTQVQVLGFWAVPLLLLSVAGSVLARGARGRRLTVQDTRLASALVFAICMYVQLYPRIDSMHLVLALPSALVLGAGAVARLGRAWGTVLVVPPRRITGGLVAGAALLAAAAVVPNYRGLVQVGPRGVARVPQVALATARAPVHVEAARAEDVRALNGVLAYLEPRLGTDEPLFAFPAVALVPYALGRSTPTPHDYFFPGRPDHLAEAKVVRVLETVRPRYVLGVNHRFGFFLQAPGYFFQLRAYLREHYALAARFGRYDVLARHDIAPSEVARDPAERVRTPASPPAPLLDVLLDPDQEMRRDALRAFLADARDGAGVVAFADTWVPDESRRLLFMRALGLWGDWRGRDYLLATFGGPESRVQMEAGLALGLLAVRADAEPYLIVPGGDLGAPAPPLTDAQRTEMHTWLGDERRRDRAGLLIAQALADANDTTAIPLLEDALHVRGLRMPMAIALVRLGRLEHLRTLGTLLGVQRHEVQDVVPSFLIDLSRSQPEAVAAELVRLLGEGEPLARENAAWIAGAASAGATAVALRTALGDPAPGVRAAAAWALGRLRDSAARGPLARLAEGEDREVAAFAREALVRIEGDAS